MAVLHAGLILAMVLLGSDPLEVDRASGQSFTLGQNGVLMFSIVVVTVHLQLAMSLDHWTWMHHASIWGSIGAFCCCWWCCVCVGGCARVCVCVLGVWVFLCATAAARGRRHKQP